MDEPEVLTTCSSRRRISIDPNHSPEFEFWMVRNPSCPQPNILSADQLFSNGILLPLHRPFFNDPPDPNPPSHKTEHESSGLVIPDSIHGPDISAGPCTSSKRWRDIFKKNDKKNTENSNDEHKKWILSIIQPQTLSQERRIVQVHIKTPSPTSLDDVVELNNENIREKEKRKKCGAVGGSSNGAELNINIWPFSRSRSAGNGGIKPRVVTRKVNSAPCSRSNSAGESKSKKWPTSPSRSGVYLGRSSPVFQVQRKVKTDQKGSKTRVLKLNVPICIGYRQHSVCRSDENSAIGVAAAESGEGVRRSNLFNIRSIFTKKVH